MRERRALYLNPNQAVVAIVAGGADPKELTLLFIRLSRIFALSLTLLAALALAQVNATKPNSSGMSGLPVSPKAVRAYGNLPLSFQPNRGQTSNEVQWLSRGPDYTLFLAGHDAVLEMNKITPVERGSAEQPKISSSALRMNLVGAKTVEQASGEEPQPGKANYFTGNDPSKWQKNVPLYGKVRLYGVYPGIDLAYYGRQGQLEYDFVVAPGADASAIRMSFNGATAKLASNGDLVLPVSGGGPEVRFHKPVVYQMKNGARQPVDGSFTIAENQQVSFKLGVYDRSRELVIDPTLIFLGALASGQGNNESLPYGMAVDAAGEIILTGATNDVTFPVTTGAYQKTCNTFSTLANQTITRCPNGPNIPSGFVTKISADGTSLVFSTYLHGISGWEYGDAVAVDSSNNEVILGATASYDFPVTADAYQSVCQPSYSGTNIVETCDGYYSGGGTEYTIDGPNLFIVKLDPTGSTILYGTFMGGTAAVYPVGLALDSSDNMYFTGFVQTAWPASSLYPNSSAIQFPTTTSAYQQYGVNPQATTLSKLSADGHTLMYSTLMGTQDTTAGYVGYAQPLTMTVGPNGIAYIGGQTTSSQFPVSTGAIKSTCGSADTPNYDLCYAATGFLSAFDTTKSGAASLVFSTYVGGTELAGSNSPRNQVLGMTADSSNNVFVTGYTTTIDYPTTTGVYQPTCNHANSANSCNTSFLTKLSSTGSLTWSTYFGGTNSSQTSGNAIALDATGKIYLYGYNNGYSEDLPVVNPLGSQFGQNFVFVATFSSDATKLLFSSPIIPDNPTTTPIANTSNISFGGLALDSQGNMYVAAYGNDGGSIVTTPGTYATTGAGPGWRGYFAKVSPVQPATTTTLTISPATANVGQSVTFTATVAGTTQTTPVPTGTVTLSNGNTTPPTTIGTITLGAAGSGIFSTSSLAAGTYSVTANYSGDANYDASASAAQTLTVNSLPATTTALVASPASGITYGQSVKLTATVTESGGTPTGSVNFLDGTTSLGSGTLNASGVATLTTSALPAGTANIMASYAGNSSTAASSTSATLTVAQAPLTATAANATRVVNTANPTFTGTVNGAVNGDTFTTTYSTTATASSPAGTYPITPAITGTHIADYNVKLVNGTLTITNSSATTTALTSSAASALVGTSLTFTANVAATGTVPPTGTVIFYNGATRLGTGTLSNSGTATYSTSGLAVGSHSITADYSGDTNNAASVSSVLTITITAPPPDFMFTLSPTSASVSQGGSATTTISLSPENGFNSATTFACSGLPKYASCTFNPASVTPSSAAATTTLTIATDVNTTTALLEPQKTHQIPARLLISGAGGAALAILFWPGFLSRRRRRAWARLLGLVILGIAIIHTTIGCGASDQTPEGTSAITLTATSGTVTHTATFQLSVK